MPEENEVPERGDLDAQDAHDIPDVCEPAEVTYAER